VVIRQHFDPVSSTYSYLLVDPASGDAVLIDPVLEQHARDAAQGLRLRYRQNR
jgi:sulfur dioxygenase